MNDKLLLVRLPPVSGEDHYGIGKYNESGEFVFIWLRPEIYQSYPLRQIPAQIFDKMAKINQTDPIEIIGEIR